MQNDLVQFDQLKADITLFVQPVLEISVKDAAAADNALASAKHVKSWAKKVEDRRKELVGPLNDQVKRINAYVKEILEPLEKAEAHLKAGLRSWEQHLEKVRQEEMRKAEAERKRLEAEAQAKMKAQQEEAAMEALFKTPNDLKRDEIVQEVEQTRVQHEIATTHKSNVKAIDSMKVSGAQKFWTFAIEDESKIPREFLSVDPKKIRQAVSAGTREIPGVNIYQDTRIAIR